MKLTLGFSPCPNDTFIFDALVHHKIDTEGLDARWKRHSSLAQYTRDWAISYGQSLFPEEGCESETITCIKNDLNWNVNAINDYLLKNGYRMDRGYGTLRGKAFRIPHMGNIYLDDLIEYLECFDEALKNV